MHCGWLPRGRTKVCLDANSGKEIQRKSALYSNYTLKYANPYDIILDLNSILYYLHVSYIFQLINYRQITKKCDRVYLLIKSVVLMAMKPHFMVKLKYFSGDI